MTDLPQESAQIAALIPHQGSMCLLDSVLRFDEQQICCRTLRHREVSHPLRSGGRLAAVHLIEHGAQAMALHSALLARASGQQAGPGLLVTVRNVQLQVAHLDQIEAAMELTATRLSAGGGGWIYSFAAHADGQLLGSGRVGVLPVAT